MKKPHWTEQDEEVVRRLWQFVSDEQIAAFMGDRTADAVGTHRRAMDLLRHKPYQMVEVRFMREWAPFMTAREIGAHLKRTAYAVYKSCPRFNISFPRGHEKRVSASA